MSAIETTKPNDAAKEAKENDITERKKMESIVNLKELKLVTEKNLNLVAKSKFDQKIVMGISTFAFLFGAAFITLTVTEKYAHTLNIAVSFLSGGLSLGALITNVKCVFQNSALGSVLVSDQLEIGPPEIDDKVAEVFVAADLEDHKSEVDVVKRIINERNYFLRFSSIYGSLVVIVGSAVAITLIGINIHYTLANQKNDYFYEVNCLLIAGGVHCLFRSITMHLALSSSDFFSRHRSFIYIFFLHLALNCLVHRNTKDEKSDVQVSRTIVRDPATKKPSLKPNLNVEEYRMEENTVFFFKTFVYVRVSLTSEEKKLVNRLLHGLRINELREKELENINITVEKS